MIRRVNIDSGVAIDQATLNQNFEETETRIKLLERAVEQVVGITGGGSVCRTVQGESVRSMRAGLHHDLTLCGLFAQVGDSVKEPTKVIIRRVGSSARKVLATVQFKPGENAGKMQIGDIEDDTMIYANDEIEIEPDGTRRVAVFMTFEPAGGL